MADQNQIPGGGAAGGPAGSAQNGQAGGPQAPRTSQTPPSSESYASYVAQSAYGVDSSASQGSAYTSNASAQAYAQAHAQTQAQQAQAAYGQAGYAQQAQAWAAQAQQPYASAAAPAAAAAVPRKKSKAPWIVGGAALFLLVFAFVVGAMSCSSLVSSLGSDMGSLDSGVVTTGDSVAVIDISGTIQYDGSACSPEGLSALLDEAENNPDIKAVVLRVDSGGGTATAGEEMAAYVQRFSKPIVVSSASMNCSAAYEISSQADYIFVNQTTAIGAIGTIMQVTDTSGLLDMLGISVDNIASAESKDSSYGTRPLTDEERAYYQDLVDKINETFIQNVAEGRGLSVDEVRALATGMQFAGTDAVGNGLADEVGIYDDALAKAAELGGLDSASGDDDVVVLTQSADLGSLMDLLGASSDDGLADLAGDSTTNEAARKLLELLKDEGVVS